MPAKVIWGLGGLADLTAIVSHISADNPSAARRMGEAILKSTRQLETFPASGRHYRQTPAGEVREIVVSPYRILYRFDERDHCVRILRVWHAARGEPDFRD